MENKKVAAVNVQRSRKKQIKNFFLAQFCQLGMKVLNRLTPIRVLTSRIEAEYAHGLSDPDARERRIREALMERIDVGEIFREIPIEFDKERGGYTAEFYVLSQEQYNTLMGAFQRMEKKIEGVAENPLKHERKPLPKTQNPGPAGRAMMGTDLPLDQPTASQIRTERYEHQSMWRVHWDEAEQSLSPEQRTAAQIGAERHEQIARMIEEQNELTLNEFARRFMLNNTELGIDPERVAENIRADRLRTSCVPNAVEGSFTEQEETPDDES